MLLQLPSASAFPKEYRLVNLLKEQTNWSRFAYTQYATDKSYLCNSVMIFEALHRLGTRADLVLMYPSKFLVSEDDSSLEARLLRFARDNYGVKLKPIEVIRKGGAGDYDRVLNLDSDATLLQTMDELFLLPPAPVAMPLAYWFYPKERVFTSGLMLIQPSTDEFNRLLEEIWDNSSEEYDMEIVNKLYGDDTLVIPHRPYMLLTGEFRAKNHEAYLGNTYESWDADKVLRAAKYLHFSDWPVPKPWVSATQHVIEQTQPACEVDPATGQPVDCHLREIWLGMYKEFMARRQNICGVALHYEGSP
ncbi:glucose N-acetyltransferase 1 [Aspergillus awamori]|uniref:Glucose N-acetyltransferase 1 n=1 Tax=Aspergillus awamori TaxID=105351 RepID=A0A401KNQ5_ASPAW|nr:glucose N-acetyltransferase 1 [Aspergillus awamori]